MINKDESAYWLSRVMSNKLHAMSTKAHNIRRYNDIMNLLKYYPVCTDMFRDLLKALDGYAKTDLCLLNKDIVKLNKGLITLSMYHDKLAVYWDESEIQTWPESEQWDEIQCPECIEILIDIAYQAKKCRLIANKINDFILKTDIERESKG